MFSEADDWRYMDESKCVFIGSWFHCGIVYGKNECLYVSLEVCICLYVRGWYFLVLVSETINISDGTATRWNDTLYIITNLVRSLRSASDGKLILLSISDTLLVLWYLLHMYRAARRWTISIFLMNSDVWGSQIEHEYSNFGLTSACYAWVFICWFDVLGFILRNPVLSIWSRKILFLETII